MDSSNFESSYIYKIVIIGDTGTGKTNIITQYVSKYFELVSRPTIGVEFFQKDLIIEGVNGAFDQVRLQIWDTAGQERFRGMASSYYRKAFGVVLVYDLTARESFNNLDRWMDEVHSYADNKIEMILAGNKNDLVADRQVTLTEGAEYSKKNQLIFYEISAMFNDNKAINEMFRQLATRIHESNKLKMLKQLSADETSKKTRNLKEITTQKKQKRKCC